MAWMRSSARGYIRPFRDRPDIRLPIRWYKVSRSNPVMELPTLFVFDQWRERANETSYPGFESSYSWEQGRDTLGLKGDHFCGTAEQWLEGPLSTDPLPPVDPTTGIPECCKGPLTHFPVVSLGGKAVGGRSLLRKRLISRGGKAVGGISSISLATPPMITSAGGKAIGGTSTLT
jgi:hypothetical protein